MCVCACVYTLQCMCLLEGNCRSQSSSSAMWVSGTEVRLNLTLVANAFACWAISPAWLYFFNVFMFLYDIFKDMKDILIGFTPWCLFYLYVCCKVNFRHTRKPLWAAGKGWQGSSLGDGSAYLFNSKVSFRFTEARRTQCASCAWNMQREHAKFQSTHQALCIGLSIGAHWAQGILHRAEKKGTLYTGHVAWDWV